MTRETDQGPALAVTMDTSAREALARMNEEGLNVLPVIGPGGRGVAGVVLRRELERRCMRTDHDSGICPVRNHLEREVATVTRQEYETRAGHVAQATRPVVVVDADGRPLHAILGRRSDRMGHER